MPSWSVVPLSLGPGPPFWPCSGEGLCLWSTGSWSLLPASQARHPHDGLTDVFLAVSWMRLAPDDGYSLMHTGSTWGGGVLQGPPVFSSRLSATTTA